MSHYVNGLIGKLNGKAGEIAKVQETLERKEKLFGEYKIHLEGAVHEEFGEFIKATFSDLSPEERIAEWEVKYDSEQLVITMVGNMKTIRGEIPQHLQPTSSFNPNYSIPVVLKYSHWGVREL
tara:strand:+ start:680 stop:1048 length:369 start_codon:yes stop_codon:yes gene_type:complete